MPTSLHILIVEDSPDDAALLEHSLRASGFDPRCRRVECEADFVNALANEPEIIISDFNLPEFTVHRALELLRTSGHDIPFIVVSGTIGEEEAVECVKAGATDYLLKHRLQRLGAAVRRALSEAAQRRKHSQAEEQLRIQATALETAADAILITDARGIIVWINPAFTMLSGYSSEETVGRNPRLLKSGVHEKPFYAALWKTILAGSTWRGEFTNRRKDGTLYYGEQTITPVRSHGGEITHFVGIMNDVTERKQAEESLNLFRALIDRSNDGFEVVDPETGRYLDVNQTTCDRHGYRREEMLALRVTDVEVGVVTEASWAEHARTIREQGFRVVEGQHRRKDGSTFPVEVNVRHIKLDRDYLVAVVRDISERKRAEAKLLASNQRYQRQESALVALTRACALRRAAIPELRREVVRVAAETLAVERTSIWRHEQAGAILVCRTMYEQKRQTYSEGMTLRAEDHPSYFVALTTGDIIDAHDAAQDERTADFRETYLRPLGIASMLDAPIHFGGSVAGVLRCEHRGPIRQWSTDEQTFALAVANVVSLLLAEEERQQFEELFRQSQKMEAIGQLAGGVAHDFNNILTAMLMQIGLVRNDPCLPEAICEPLGDVEKEIQRATSLTRQLLLFSRRQVMQPRQLDLNEVVTSLAKMLQRIIGEDVRLQLHLHTKPLFTQADAGMLDQVLLNLAVNARDAMPNGGRLLIETAQKFVDEDFARLHPDATPGRHVWLSVSDTGGGIPREVLPRIFEPFFTTKDPGKGTGLGLSTVFGIVKQHHGWIKVYSEPGQGANFQIFLPASSSHGDELPEPAVRQKPRGGSESILLVEDETRVRALTRLILERAGYRVLDAPHGVAALRIWEKERGQIQLLLTDMVMPEGISGRQLAQQLREQQPGLKVIFTSGYSAEIAGRELVLQAGQKFIQKPSAPDDLLGLVRACLDENPSQ